MRLIDEASFKAGMEKMRADLAPAAASRDDVGAAARCMILAGEGMHRFITSEIEKDTDPDFILTAIACFSANILAGFMANLEFVPPDSPKSMIEEFLGRTAARTVDIVRRGDGLDANSRTDIRYTDGGRA